MSFDYFYGQQSDLFTFYRVPKVLFTNERFWNISADAKMLYGILLDRMSLSAKNGWIDKNGRVYIIFTIDEAKMALNCAEQKAIKLLSELEKKAGLIERKRQGLGKPNLIYVKNFISADRVDDKKSNIVEIYHDLTNGNAAPYRDFLEQVIEDSDEISVVQAATQLKNELDKAVSRPKESVIDQLKQISGQTVPSKMSHSFKEPER